MDTKPKLLLIAYRAFGDWLFTCSVLPALFDKYEVYLETNFKGYLLLHDDPRFKQIAYNVDVDKLMTKEDREKAFEARWQTLRDTIKPDVEINLNGTLEVECISEIFQPEFHYSVGDRRAIFGHRGFYDAVWNKCGIPLPEDFDPNGMYFHPHQEEHVKQWREKYKDNFIVVIPIAGSTAQKVFHGYKDTALAILDKYPDAVVYFAGDEKCRPFAFEHPRVKTIIGNDVDIKQSVHMMKYADMVIGPETYLLVAAGMFGTPKIILATTSGIYQMAQYQRNDFSIQAPIHCSPCHRSIYYDNSCETPILDADNKFVTTSCSKTFRVEDIMQRVSYIKQRWDDARKPKDL